MYLTDKIIVDIHTIINKNYINDVKVIASLAKLRFGFINDFANKYANKDAVASIKVIINNISVTP